MGMNRHKTFSQFCSPRFSFEPSNYTERSVLFLWIFLFIGLGGNFLWRFVFFFKLSLRHVSIAFLAALPSHCCLSQRCFCLCRLVHLWAHAQFMTPQSTKTTLSHLNLSFATQQCVFYGGSNPEHPVRSFGRIYFSWLKKKGRYGHQFPPGLNTSPGLNISLSPIQFGHPSTSSSAMIKVIYLRSHKCLLRSSTQKVPFQLLFAQTYLYHRRMAITCLRESYVKVHLGKKQNKTFSVSIPSSFKVFY